MRAKFINEDVKYNKQEQLISELPDIPSNIIDKIVNEDEGYEYLVTSVANALDTGNYAPKRFGHNKTFNEVKISGFAPTYDGKYKFPFIIGYEYVPASMNKDHSLQWYCDVDGLELLDYDDGSIEEILMDRAQEEYADAMDIYDTDNANIRSSRYDSGVKFGR